MAIHPSPLQASYRLRLTLLTTVSIRSVISNSSLSTFLYLPVSLPSLTWGVCSLRSSASTLSSEAVSTSQECSNISKLVGVVWVVSGVPMPVHFTHQVIRFQRSSVTSYLVTPNSAGIIFSLNAATSGAKRVSALGVCVRLCFICLKIFSNGCFEVNYFFFKGEKNVSFLFRE